MLVRWRNVPTLKKYACRPSLSHLIQKEGIYKSLKKQLFFTFLRSVPVEYEWTISLPIVTSDGTTSSSGEDQQQPPPFQIHPSSGVLDEEAAQSFDVIFSPSSVST